MREDYRAIYGVKDGFSALTINKNAVSAKDDKDAFGILNASLGGGGVIGGGGSWGGEC